MGPSKLKNNLNVASECRAHFSNVICFLSFSKADTFGKVCGPTHLDASYIYLGRGSRWGSNSRAGKDESGEKLGRDSGLVERETLVVGGFTVGSGCIQVL